MEGLRRRQGSSPCLGGAGPCFRRLVVAGTATACV